MGLPFLSSTFSRKTSISEPIVSSLGSMNSEAGIAPSDFPPISTMTSLGRILVIMALTMAPFFRFSKLLEASRDSISEYIYVIERKPIGF